MLLVKIDREIERCTRQFEKAASCIVRSLNGKETACEKVVPIFQIEIGCPTQRHLSRVQLISHAVGIPQLSPGTAPEIHKLTRSELSFIQSFGEEHRGVSKLHHLVRIVVAERPTPLQESLIHRKTV